MNKGIIFVDYSSSAAQNKATVINAIASGIKKCANVDNIDIIVFSDNIGPCACNMVPNKIGTSFVNGLLNNIYAAGSNLKVIKKYLQSVAMETNVARVVIVTNQDWEHAGVNLGKFGKILDVINIAGGQAKASPNSIGESYDIKSDRASLRAIVESYGAKDVLNYVKSLNEDTNYTCTASDELKLSEINMISSFGKNKRLYDMFVKNMNNSLVNRINAVLPDCEYITNSGDCDEEEPCAYCEVVSAFNMGNDYYVVALCGPEDIEELGSYFIPINVDEFTSIFNTSERINLHVYGTTFIPDSFDGGNVIIKKAMDDDEIPLTAIELPVDDDYGEYWDFINEDDDFDAYTFEDYYLAKDGRPVIHIICENDGQIYR